MRGDSSTVGGTSDSTMVGTSMRKWAASWRAAAVAAAAIQPTRSPSPSACHRPQSAPPLTSAPTAAAASASRCACRLDCCCRSVAGPQPPTPALAQRCHCCLLRRVCTLPPPLHHSPRMASAWPAPRRTRTARCEGRGQRRPCRVRVGVAPAGRCWASVEPELGRSRASITPAPTTFTCRRRSATLSTSAPSARLAPR